MSRPADIRAFFDEATNSVSYLVADSESRVAAVIDPVLDFDAPSGTISTRSADAIIAASEEQGQRIEWVLETHAHADHLSAGGYLRTRTDAKLGIGAQIRDVQQVFGTLFEADDLKPGAGDFDFLLSDGDTLPLGELTIEAMATPGHTPACVSYRVGDALFVGDTLFMPDSGTARCDFPGGDAQQLYRSIQRIFALPPETRLFLCHDYKAPGRDCFAWESTVSVERASNVHIGGAVTEEDYVTMREARDATLSAPKLLYPAIQVNIRAGRLPPCEPNGRSYLKIPLSVPTEMPS